MISSEDSVMDSSVGVPSENGLACLRLRELIMRTNSERIDDLCERYATLSFLSFFSLFIFMIIIIVMMID